MTMVDAARSDEIYAELGPAQETSGGSAANTAVGRRRRSAGAPRSSAASPTTRSARCSRTTCAAPASQFDVAARDRRLAHRALPRDRRRRRRAHDVHVPRRRRRARSARRRRRPDRERGGHVPRGLPLGRGRGQGRDPPGRVARARRRPQGRAHALRPVLRRAPPRRVPRADRVRHRHPLRQRGRDHDAVRGRHASTRPLHRVRGALRDRGAHPRRARLGRRRRRRACT